MSSSESIFCAGSCFCSWTRLSSLGTRNWGAAYKTCQCFGECRQPPSIDRYRADLSLTSTLAVDHDLSLAATVLVYPPLVEGRRRFHSSTLVHASEFAFAVTSGVRMADVLVRCGMHAGDLNDGRYVSIRTSPLLYLRAYLLFVRAAVAVVFSTHDLDLAQLLKLKLSRGELAPTYSARG